MGIDNILFSLSKNKDTIIVGGGVGGGVILTKTGTEVVWRTSYREMTFGVGRVIQSRKRLLNNWNF